MASLKLLSCSETVFLKCLDDKSTEKQNNCWSRVALGFEKLSHGIPNFCVLRGYIGLKPDMHTACDRCFVLYPSHYNQNQKGFSHLYWFYYPFQMCPIELE